ncbi:hypothetical protein MES4922_120002 [Mesorhizobium ventifaucium]|uniref:Uncharacterized protein n=1 Tax=Mesorhizobium ventifaucium TaxID=666020 RepID=A0ABN8JAR4_9HYPH|nr:hypothetical protein MES4922_120002 [Mesorhizobium ventifaucium]
MEVTISEFARFDDGQRYVEQIAQVQRFAYIIERFGYRF